MSDAKPSEDLHVQFVESRSFQGPWGPGKFVVGQDGQKYAIVPKIAPDLPQLEDYIYDSEEEWDWAILDFNNGIFMHPFLSRNSIFLHQTNCKW